MDFHQRIDAVLHGRAPDMVPFAPYDNLMPRGRVERQLRNQGMGLCSRVTTIWSETPHVSVESVTKDDTARTIYHTPVGSISTGWATHRDRIGGGGRVQTEWLVKEERDIEAVISMVDGTVFHPNPEVYQNAVRDLGTDGIVRGTGLTPPYDACETFFGLEAWTYAQQDWPEAFARLLAALERRQERLFRLVVEQPADFIAFGSVSGCYSPEQYRQWVLPFYRRYVPRLRERGKICVLHAHNSNLEVYADVIRDTGVDVVEAFTPPPVGDLSLAAARRAWGEDMVIWVNFPETIFYHGVDATREYTANLLRNDPPGGRLVIGATEMGLFGAADPETDRAFQDGYLAVLDTINEVGRYPIRG
jgi:hypothetical protein